MLNTPKERRDSLIAKMNQEGIQCRLPFRPLRLQAYVTEKKVKTSNTKDFWVSDRLGDSIVNLPSAVSMSDDDLETVSTSLIRLLG